MFIPTVLNMLCYLQMVPQPEEGGFGMFLKELKV